MHLLYCDETNLEPRKGDFLIYGGLMLPPTSAIELSAWFGIEARKLPKDYDLKFNPRPEGMSQSDFWDFKDRVIDKAVSSGAKLLATAILHDIAKDTHQGRRNAINTVCLNYNGELKRNDTHGLVLIDRFEDKGKLGDKHIKTKFAVGLEGLPYSKTMRLDRILGLHYSAIGQSHFPSFTDVVLGSLRFAFNAITRPEPDNEKRAKLLVERLAPLFLGYDRCGGKVPEVGLQFSPKKIDVSTYLDRYIDLKRTLENWGLPTLQAISSQRTY